jgi:sigma-B regulation protein RsbU (phosphoserine phosphatase)
VFKPEFIHINIGDQILLYTDGVTEAFNSDGEVFSDDRLLQLVNNHQTDGSMQLVRKIQQEIKLFVKNADQSDDITILAVTYNGK